MARVFRGKMAIPGDQMEAYLEALGQFEKDKEPLRSQLEHYARDFVHALAHHSTPKTVRKHTGHPRAVHRLRLLGHRRTAI